MVVEGVTQDDEHTSTPDTGRFTALFMVIYMNGREVSREHKENESRDEPRELTAVQESQRASLYTSTDRSNVSEKKGEARRAKHTQCS